LQTCDAWKHIVEEISIRNKLIATINFGIVGGVADPPTALPGLRERKKQRTREAISDIATALFAERGFENVTIAEIAQAADVSTGTVFNYFLSKEDLFFDRADEVLATLQRAITGRPAGTTAIGALHGLLRDHVAPVRGFVWKHLEDPGAMERFAAFRRTEASSPALRARRAVLQQEWVAPLAQTLRDDLGLPAGDVRAEALAAFVLAAMTARDRVLSEAVLASSPPRTIRRRVQAITDETFGRLATAFADIDR